MVNSRTSIDLTQEWLAEKASAETDAPVAELVLRAIQDYPKARKKEIEP